MKKLYRAIALVLSTAMLSTCADFTVLADEIIEVSETSEVEEISEATEDSDQFEVFVDENAADEIVIDENASVENTGDVEAEPQMDEGFDDDFMPGYVPAPYEDDYESVGDGAEDGFFAVTERKYVSPIAQQFPTRNQNPYGTCWAFASIAAAEMSAAKHGVILTDGSAADSSVNLSELHLAYFGGNGLEVYDPLGGMSGDYNGVPASSNFLENGGSADNAAHLFASWIGTANESKYGYDSAGYSYSTDRTNEMDDELHLRNFYAVKHATDRDAVKKLIQDYGMVTTSYCHLKSSQYITIDGAKFRYSDAYSSVNNCYYIPAKVSSNHAVSIIGWDDDFPKENFQYSTKPEGNGAWLIRNSWVSGVKVDADGNPVGTSEKYNTYFWLSYYDASMRDTCYAFDMEPVSKYNNNYQYDGSMTGVTAKGVTKYANIFKTKKDAEILEAVFFSTHSSNFEYTIDVYTGVSLGNPTKGTHVIDGQKGKVTYPGGNTIDLTSPVDLKKDEMFSVIITVPKDTQIDMENSSTSSYVTTAHTESGRSLYYFNGEWKNSSEFAKTDTTDYKIGDIRIKAFTTNAIPITFNANGGKIGTETVKTKNYRNGSQYGEMPVPTRTGYDLVGWFTAETGGTKVTAEDVVTEEKTLYAQWSPKKFKVTFDPNGGTCPVTSAEVEYDSTYGKTAALPVAVRDGYGFDGWYTAKTGGSRIVDDTVVSLTADQTLYAHWDANKYTVTFDGNGGTPSESSKAVTYGGKYGTLPTATRLGYSFDGWFTEKTGGTKVTSSTVVDTAGAHTLYAQWSINTYTVTLDANGGTIGSSSTKTITVTFGGKYGPLVEATRLGYDFDGWYTEKTGGTRITSDSIVETGSNHKLYAHWDGYLYDIVFEPQGGHAASLTKKVKNGTPFGEMPVPEKEGSDFVGWYTATTAGKRVTEDTIVDITSAMTLYARWDVKKIKVTLNANGGSYADGASMTVYVDWGDKLLKKDLTKPSRRRFDFTDWYSDSACTTLFDFDKAVKDEVTIYAGWKESGYKGFKIEDLDSYRYEYNGSAIKPYFSVYYYEEGTEKRLNYGTDYSVTYSNNVNAGKGDKTGKTGPSVTVRGKGNYTDTLSEGFDIDAVDMNTVYMDIDSAVNSGKAEHHIELIYNGKAQKLEPVLKADLASGKTVTLKNGSDYKLMLNGSVVDSVKAVAEYDITIQGIGNYTGTRELKVEVVAAGTSSFAKVKFPSIPNQSYDGSSFILAGASAVGEKRAVDRNGNQFEWVLTDSSLKPAYTLQYGVDYDLSYLNNSDAGTATVTVLGKGNYAGSVSKTFKIDGIAMSKVTYPAGFGASTLYKKYYDNGTKKFSYFGGEFQVAGPANIGKDKWNNETYGIDLYYNGTKLDKGDDYTVTYLKNTEPGTASVVFTGKGKFSGSSKKTFGIQSLDMNSNIEGYTVKIMTEDGLVEWNPKDVTFAYVKGGVKPVPVVMLEDEVLTEGVDYKLSWSNYSKPLPYNATNTRGKSIAPTVTITGKGYFKGKTTRTYSITSGELKSIVASDVAYAENKAGVFTKTKIICEGQELRSGTDFYSLTDMTNTTYTFVSFDNDDSKTTGTVKVKDGRDWTPKTVNAGDIVDKTYCVQTGTKIKVSITGKGYFAGQKAEATFCVEDQDFSKASIKIPNMTYTGKTVTKADVLSLIKTGGTITVGAENLTCGIEGRAEDQDKDCLITYVMSTKNVGSVKVTIKGNPQKGYAGIKTATFRIYSRSFQ